MKKYILVSGIHSANGKTYLPGDTVESETDLAARFPERFEVWQPGDDDPTEPAEKEG